ncbi:uroporphyrinogen-III synthase [Aureimonas glaciei]|uniref:Tetrapyrrole biosynthesis uroporphyrinogen III synthase domain-containing protein n=1 Tax=Aureimonas glaciei TaxID=1776957 RepID=A0A916YE84_9HYPH|nr:uroporphyrinogen-III synthase [Aureimonas glaciei]GGD41266.1 hypothetical protein GCM10011335_50000 [Aureimonas glaciei]
MARVLILRPAEDAATTARALAARGHTPQVLPAEEIVPLGTAAPAGSFAALLVTSAHAVPALARHPSAAWPAILAVGERTAEALRAAGFDRVTVGCGAAGLVEPAAALAAARGLPLLYAAGRVRSDALETTLAERSVCLGVWEVYDIRPLDPGQEEIARATQGAPPDAVLLLSRGQVSAYLRLAESLPREPGAAPRLLCLSSRIADALPAELRSLAEISPAMSLATLFDHVL